MEYKPQVSEDHYRFDNYFSPARWMSYYHQVRQIATRDDVKTVLDIGPGTTFLKNVLLSQRPDIRYESLDMAADVKPDHIGSITKIPLPDNSYDAVCAFQVLEHIEFKDVEQALAEMARVSKKYIMISVPHFGPTIQLHLKIPMIKLIRSVIRFPRPVKHEFDGQHYWELGKRGYPVTRFKKLLSHIGELKVEFVPFENQYHHFFILEKKYDN